MILELASFLGTSVGGKLFGMISDTMAEKRHNERENMEIKHRQRLAELEQLGDYYEKLNTPSSDGTYSPLSRVVAFTIGLFAITYCYATLSCFIDNPAQVIFTKDPSGNSSAFSLLGGFITWDIANNRVLEMSKVGLGYLLLHPVVFILSMATTGDKPGKR